jgi:undecaprenyl pyrophosphate phosphatase UppP
MHKMNRRFATIVLINLAAQMLLLISLVMQAFSDGLKPLIVIMIALVLVSILLVMADLIQRSGQRG